MTDDEEVMFSARVSKALRREIKALAVAEDRSVAELTVEALEDLLRKYARKQARRKR